MPERNAVVAVMATQMLRRAGALRRCASKRSQLEKAASECSNVASLAGLVPKRAETQRVERCQTHYGRDVRR
jgi:hypothetical protein